MPAEPTSYRARWIFPTDGEPLPNATLEIAAGRITELHQSHNPRSRDLGNVALIPGLVNAHTHLEFSDLRQPIAPSVPFTAWIRAVVAHRRAQPHPHALRSSIASGFAESLAAGTTTVGEIQTQTQSLPSAQTPRIVAFRELIGLRSDQADAQFQIAADHLQQPAQSGLIRGLSPHAPYSVHPDLVTRLVELAVAHEAPIAMHVAESPAERDLLQHGTGEFVELLRDFGVWQPDAIPLGARPLDYLRQLARAKHALVIHGNDLDAEEQAFVAAHENLCVVYCPRTHAYFGHAPHPWRALHARGAHVALGTDSRASNPDLSLWRELQFLRARFPEVAPRELLALATRNGARALGLGDATGTLTPGKSADVCAVALPASDGNPWSLLFDPQAAVTRTMTDGQWCAA